MSPAQQGDTATGQFDTYEVLGYRARVEIADRNVRELMREILGGFGPIVVAPDAPFVPYQLIGDAAGVWHVAVRGLVRRTEADLATALATLEWQILTDALARCRDRFHLHGASLATPDQRDGIALIGESGSGKTTLTLGLALRGFLPLSDDVTLLDSHTLEAQPFPRAFHLEPGTRQILESRALPASWDLARMPPGYFTPPRWSPAPVPVRVVLFPQYQAGGTAHLTPLPIADAAAALLQNTISLARVPKVALATVARLTATAACYRFVSGDLDSALDTIVALLASQPSSAGERQ